MRKELCFALLLSTGAASLFAAQAGKLGVGAIVGQPTGPTLKYWFTERSAIDLGYGFNHDGILYGDYLWHGWDIRTEKFDGRSGVYLGLGGRFEHVDHDHEKFAARAPIGLDFFFNKYPVELFAEMVPVLQFTPVGELNLDGGVGARFYFSGK